MTSILRGTILNKGVHLKGAVMTGYGRGGKQLGVPTANHPQFDAFLKQNGVKTGVYFGWGAVDGEPMTGLVANVGYSPTFVGEVCFLDFTCKEVHSPYFIGE